MKLPFGLEENWGSPGLKSRVQYTYIMLRLKFREGSSIFDSPFPVGPGPGKVAAQACFDARRPIFNFKMLCEHVPWRESPQFQCPQGFWSTFLCFGYAFQEQSRHASSTSDGWLLASERNVFEALPTLESSSGSFEKNLLCPLVAVSEKTPLSMRVQFWLLVSVPMQVIKSLRPVSWWSSPVHLRWVVSSELARCMYGFFTRGFWYCAHGSL
jgi:hypothetical protein